MPTFVDEIQSVASDDAVELRRRIADRVEAVSDAVGVLESWTEESDETRAELASKYDTAKSLARDEIRDAADTEADDADALAPADLVTHPAVSDDTKRRLSEYGTKLHAFLDEERSYGAARERLRTALADELSLYQRLLEDLETRATVRNAQEAIARFAREETPGPPNHTATDVLLESASADGEPSDDEREAS